MEQPKGPWLDALTAAARFAWPAAFVAVFAMAFAWLRESRPEPPSTVAIEHNGATVVHQLRALSRLETASLRVEKVIDLKDHQERLHGLVDGNDSILFVAAGEVVLGVDLGGLRDDELRWDPATKVARIALHRQVLVTRFDEAHSYVHSRKTDLFAKSNVGLESMARREALAAFAVAGRDPQAVATAKARTEDQLRRLARAWGASDLVVDWAERTMVGRELSFSSRPAPLPGL